MKYDFKFSNILVSYSRSNNELIFSSGGINRVVILPRLYHYKFDGIISTKFIIYNLAVYKAVISSLSTIICSFSKLRMIRLRLRGLGFCIDEITDKFYSLCFNWINYIYFFVPSELQAKAYKKRFLILGFEWQVLKLVLISLLKLKCVGPYNLRGLRMPRGFSFIRRRKKI